MRQYDTLIFSWIMKNIILVRENLFMPYAHNKDADQPAYPHCLISVFVIRCIESIMPLVSISEISSL